MYYRAVIRQALVSALSSLTVPVTVGRVYPEQPATLPAVNVVTGDDANVDAAGTMNPNAANSWIQSREAEFQIECRALADGTDDALDAIALEVEQALGADVTLGGVVDKIEYLGSASELAGDLESPAGLLTLTYQTEYRVNARDPQSLED